MNGGLRIHNLILFVRFTVCIALFVFLTFINFVKFLKDLPLCVLEEVDTACFT